MRGRALRGAMLVATLALGSAAVAQESLRTIEVVGVSPVAGSGVDIDKTPSTVVSIGPSAFSHTKTSDLIQAMMQGIPLVAPSDQTGNQFLINLDDRGFSASSVQGTSQGIAVHQSGVCINEVYGDVVNWDFIPEMAINHMTPMPNNPLFGLNAIGGAFPSI
jgi:iron complex outermembrane recepter protein